MSSTDPFTVVELRGDIDLLSCAAAAARVQEALTAGLPVLVDLSECMFIDLAGLRGLRECHREAAATGVPFVALVPYAASSSVRRLVLELAPELAPYPVVSRRSSAGVLFAPREDVSLNERRLAELRAALWANARTLEELAARRDALMFDQQRLLDRCRELLRGRSA